MVSFIYLPSLGHLTTAYTMDISVPSSLQAHTKRIYAKYDLTVCCPSGLKLAKSASGFCPVAWSKFFSEVVTRWTTAPASISASSASATTWNTRCGCDTMTGCCLVGMLVTTSI